MPRDDLQHRAVEWVEAFNDADWRHHEELYAPRLTYNLLEVTLGRESTAGGATSIGTREEVLAAWMQIKERNRGLKFIVENPDAWIVDEGKDTVIGLVTWSGPDLTSGKQTEIPGALVFSVPIDEDDENRPRRITQLLEYGNWLACPMCAPA